jgi:hypothetical protein
LDLYGVCLERLAGRFRLQALDIQRSILRSEDIPSIAARHACMSADPLNPLSRRGVS